MNDSNNTYGIRVESGRNNGADVVEFGGFFNQSNSLAGTYSNEIQLVNGFFQTKASSTDGYINYSENDFYNPTNCNYPNYTSINSDARYLTVQYYNNVTGQNYSFIGLNIDTPINFTQDNNGFLLSNIRVQYKIVNPVKPNPDDITSITTGWLNGNLNGVVSNTTKSNFIGGFYKNIPSASSTPSLRYLQVVSGTGAAPFITYIRIGVPLNENVRWKRLFLTFIS
jgi:hypothetical protein